MSVHSPVVATDGPLWITCSAFPACDWQTMLTEYGGETDMVQVHREFNWHLAERFHMGQAVPGPKGKTR